MKRIFAICLLTGWILWGCSATVPVTEMPAGEYSLLETTIETTLPETETTRVTEETTEPTVEETQWTAPPAQESTVFVRIVDYIPFALERLAYATEENFTGTVIYGFTEAYLRYGTLEKLMAAAQRLEKLGYGIVIWDAYRPVYGQERLWEAYPDPAYVSPPGTGTQAHCRGNAVDITLYDLQTGFLLEMPTDFDAFTAEADRDYRDVSEEAADNARLLEQIMTECGFRPYNAEWWHFTDTDSYPIEYEFDPGIHS